MASNPAFVPLAAPDLAGELPLETCLNRRRSVRHYAKGSVSVDEISRLLWAAQGITAASEHRTAPSGGALYPLDLYVVCGDLDGLAGGLYRYMPSEHTLDRLGDDDLRAALCAAALGQECVGEAPVSLICAAVYERSTAKYGERGRRYAVIESGAVSQNLYLQAVPLGLGTVILGAFDDEAVRAALGLGADSAPLWIMPFGRL